MDFRERHVVITGGTGALGIAVVEALLDQGATCHIPYMHDEEAARFPHRAHRNVHLQRVHDLAEESEVANVYAAAPALWASIHLAGGFAAAAITETDKSALMQQLEINVVTTFISSAAAIRAMRASAKGGRIVNVAARPALEPRAGAGMVAYAASKAAVAALTTAAAAEMVKENILINAVAPSIMDTPANRAAMPKADHSAWPKTDEVAAAILFLASPQNTLTSGAIMPVFGRS